MASINEGKYVGNKEPYAYRRVKLEKQKGYTLEIKEDEAQIVKLVFEYFTIGQLQADGTLKRLGTTNIAKHLNATGIPTASGKSWTTQTVSFILRNPVYIGKIKWGGRPAVKRVENGEILISRPRLKLEDITVVDGLHKAIIDNSQWDKAQEILSNNPGRKVPSKYIVKNPLSGIVVCGVCGKNMTRRPYKNCANEILLCQTLGCPTVSAPLPSVERVLLKSLEIYLEEYKAQLNEEKLPELEQNKTSKKLLQTSKNELTKLQKQLDNLHDLLEQGVYTTETFLKRSRIINDKSIEVANKIEELEKQMLTDKESLHKQNDIIPRIKHVIQAYAKAEDIEQKNDLLKSVIIKAVYNKSVSGRWHGSPDDFTLSITPKG